MPAWSLSGYRVFAVGVHVGIPGYHRRVDVPACGAAGVTLPTPAANLGRGTGTPSVDLASARLASGRRNLDDAIAMLPTPVARDGDGRGEGTPACWAERMRERAEGVPLGAALRLIPERWGQYADAVARQEAWAGPAPAPTEPNRNGNPRLRAEFAEWMMGWPAGWVTDLLDRSPALVRIGNGVMPRQAVRALCLSLESLKSS